MVTQSPGTVDERPLSGRRYGDARTACVAGRRDPGPVLLTEAALAEAVPARARRRDALPEHTRYVDRGCDLHPSCLSCPLVRCRYDEPGGPRKAASRDRDESMLRLRRYEGVTIEGIARQLGVSRRTVFRVLARARDEETARW